MAMAWNKILKTISPEMANDSPSYATPFPCLSTLLLIFVLLFSISSIADGDIGVDYGRMGSNLPSPAEVVALYTQNKIKQMRIYEPDPATLQALEGSAIELIVGLYDFELQPIAEDLNKARAWVQKNIADHHNLHDRFKHISVGNENAYPHANGPSVVLSAMTNLHTALDEVGLCDKIKVSTTLSMGCLAESYPPSKGEFKSQYLPVLNPIIKFLKDNNSPLLINMYPYFAYANNPGAISLKYALFTSDKIVVRDGSQVYWNLFDAMLDAVYSALEKVDCGSIEVIVTETGWPTQGGVDTTIENARTYNQNLIWHVNNNGTPKRPNYCIKAYIFAMFDENQKKGDETERHWGIFYPNKQPKYFLNFTC